jgi:hypothetical protein
MDDIIMDTAHKNNDRLYIHLVLGNGCKWNFGTYASRQVAVD